MPIGVTLRDPDSAVSKTREIIDNTLNTSKQVADTATGDEEKECAPGSDTFCNWLAEKTGNRELAQWVTELNIDVWHTCLVLAIGLCLSWVARRAINRITQNIISGESGRSRWSKRAARVVVDPDPDRGMRRVQRARAVGQVLRSLSTVVIYTIMILLILTIWGVNVGPMLASASVLGVALGFGAQAVIKDFLSGLFMLLEDQYGVGDIIDINGTSGTVEAVGLRVTRMRDIEGVVWYVRNGEITQVGNMSQGWARAVLDIGVGYSTDVDFAEDVITEVATLMYEDPNWHPLILNPPEVWGVQDLGDNAVSLRLVITTQPLEQWKVAREVRRRIKLRFDREGIEIPFPQQTVWHRQENAEELPPGSAGPARVSTPRGGESDCMATREAAKRAAEKATTGRNKVPESTDELTESDQRDES